MSGLSLSMRLLKSFIHAGIIGQGNYGGRIKKQLNKGRLS